LGPALRGDLESGLVGWNEIDERGRRSGWEKLAITS
jgi:hypothetical protein